MGLLFCLSSAAISACGFSVLEGLSSETDMVSGNAGDSQTSGANDSGQDLRDECDGDECDAPSCENGKRDGRETGIDCGGENECARCDVGVACLAHVDCETQVCGADETCADAICADKVRNGEETDIDCGGNGNCPRCDVMRACLNGSDCVSSVCEASICRPPSCDDGALNGDETGPDCGGACAPDQQCGAGLACVRDSDCARPYCLAQICRSAHARDDLWPLPGTIEAEAFDEGGEGVGYHDATAGNEGAARIREGDVDLEPTMDVGGGHNQTLGQASEWLAYSVDIEAEAPDYNFELRTAARDDVGRLHLELDGEPLGGSIMVPRTAGAQRFTTVERNRVALPAGRHVLRVVHDTDGVKLNWLRVTRGAAPYGGVPWAVPGSIEAEDFDVGGEGVAYHAVAGSNKPELHRATNVDLDECTDAGGGYQVTAARAGEWLQYTVDAADEGAFTFEARVSTALSSQTLRLEIDGEDVTGSIAIESTGSFQSYTTVSVPGIPVSKGRHRVRLVFETGFVDVNWLRFASE